MLGEQSKHVSDRVRLKRPWERALAARCYMNTFSFMRDAGIVGKDKVDKKV